MASGRPTPLGGLARPVQTMPGALANHWTSQSYQGVWGPCVSVRQTVTQGWPGCAGGWGREWESFSPWSPDSQAAPQTWPVAILKGQHGHRGQDCRSQLHL